MNWQPNQRWCTAENQSWKAGGKLESWKAGHNWKPKSKMEAEKQRCDELEAEIKDGAKLLECSRIAFENSLRGCKADRKKQEKIAKAAHATTLYQTLAAKREYEYLESILPDLRRDCKSEETLEAPVSVSELWHQELHQESVSDLSCYCLRQSFFLASCSSDALAVVQKVEPGLIPKAEEPIGFVMEPEGNAFSSVTFVPGASVQLGWMLATANVVGQVHVWNMDTSELVHEFVSGSDSPVTYLAAVDSDMIAGVDSANIHAWSIEATHTVRLFPHQGEILGMCHPEKQTIVSLCDSGCLSLWDLRQSRRICQITTDISRCGTPALDAVRAQGSNILIAATAGSSFQAWDLRRAPRPLCDCPNLFDGRNESDIIGVAIDPISEWIAFNCVSLGAADEANVFVDSLFNICSRINMGTSTPMETSTHYPQSLISQPSSYRWAANAHGDPILIIGDAKGAVRAASCRQ